MADDRRNDDIWAQLLGAAQTEAAKQQNITAPKNEPEDPWVQLLGAAEKHIEEQESTAAASDAPFAKGAMLLGTYRIESDPMHGGMGDVWRVRHTGWNVDLAMKRPQEKMFSGESSKQGFIDECRNWINLGLHPNIVSCYYVREIDGVPTIFSEWMENGDLKHHIDNGTLYDGSEEEVRKRLLDIAIQYARGLHYAHEQGLIHQDVKPANLLLTNDWQAKAADFGLAGARAQLTVLEGEPTERDSGQSLNAAAGGYTPAYCSPEQMAGNNLTRRTDIWSWAVSVLEMYYGSRPWTNGVVAGAGCREYFSGCRIRMPEVLQGLLARCLEMDPDFRPHDFGIIEAELTKIWRESFGEDSLRPAPKAAADNADSLNNRALTYLDLNMPEKAEECWAAALEKEPGHPEATYNQGLYEWRGGRIRYPEMARRCASLAASGSPDSADAIVRFQEQAERENEDRAPIAIWRIDHQSENTYVPLGTHPKVAFSPDGRLVYSAFDTLSCHQAEPLKELYSNPEAIGNTMADRMRITPDGKYLVYRKMNPDSARYNGRKARGVPGEAGDESWLWVADAATGAVVRRIHAHPMKMMAFCLLPEGNECVTVGTDGTQIQVYRWDLETGTRTAVLEEPEHDHLWDAQIACASPDGRLLCVLFSFRVALWDLETGRVLRAEKRLLECWDACFFPDGKRILSCRRRFMELEIWDLETLDFVSFPVPAETYHVWINPEGTRILTDDDDRQLTLRDAESLRVLRVFQWHEGQIRGFDVTPDLRRIVSVDWFENVVLWDAVKPVRLAPWEVSRIRQTDAVLRRQQAEDRLRAEIEKALETGQNGSALSLLKKAESEYDPYRFFALRRELTRRCGRKDLEGLYEFNSYQPEAWKLKSDMYRNGSVRFRPSGRTVAIRYESSPLLEFREDTGRIIRTLQMPDSFDRHQVLREMDFSPDGKYLAADGQDSVLLLDLDSEDEPRQLYRENKKRGIFVNPVFSPDGRMLAANCGTTRGFGMSYTVAHVWNTDTGELVLNKDDENHEIKDLWFLADGKRLAVLKFRRLEIWSLPGGEVEKDITLDVTCMYIRLSADGKTLYLFTGGLERRILFLDTETWTFTDPPFYFADAKASDDNLYFRFSPDDTLLAVAVEKEIRIWSFRDRKLVRTLSMTDWVADLAFSPDSCIMGATCHNFAHFWALQWNLAVPDSSGA